MSGAGDSPQIRVRVPVRGSRAQAWLDEWERLLDAPPSELIDVFLGTA